MSTDVPTLIERREYKYLITQQTAAGIREAIRPFCAIDPWAARSPSRTYLIDSLYFDTPGLALYWANEHEQVDRIKMRVRGYPEVAGGPVFFEVKRRINDVISKSRGRVPQDLWAQLLRDPSAPIPDGVQGKDRVAVERFVSLARSLHIRPLTIVRYRREPYFSLVDDYARVTFDTHIRARAADGLSLESSDRGWRALDDAVSQRTLSSLVVLELKFTRSVPVWLVDLVRRFDLYRGSYSKYGSSMRAMFQAPEGRTSRLAGGVR